MAFKVKVNVNSAKTRRKIKKYVRQSLKSMATVVKEQILIEIRGGRSPVKGFGRFPRYSDSYRAAIKMKAAFRTLKNGKIIAWNKLSNKDLRQFRASKQARKENKGVGDKIYDLNSKLREKNKKVSPVNLTLTGDLLNSLKVKVKKNELDISFDNKLFKIHNNEGAGKSKTKRRLLPDGRNETFNRSIVLRVREVVGDVAKRVFG
jgi:hypothetical protein